MTSQHLARAALALALSLSAACGDDAPSGPDPGTGTECGAGTTLMGSECVSDFDATCGSGTIAMSGVCVPVAPTTTYRQVEMLGRPGIAEALLITPAYLEGYNATAPSFAGAPPTAVAAITAEAKTVLKALYLGACLLNGLVGFDGTNGVHPAGTTCVASGGNIFTNDNPLTGTVLDTNSRPTSCASTPRCRVRT